MDNATPNEVEQVARLIAKKTGEAMGAALLDAGQNNLTEEQIEAITAAVAAGLTTAICIGIAHTWDSTTEQWARERIPATQY